MSNLFLSFDDYTNCSLDDFKNIVGAAATRKVSSLTIGDLSSLLYPNGIYFFYDDSLRQLQYVGKCTSRSFIERLPAHFDQRELAWFNNLPKKVAQKSNINYSEALIISLDFKVVLLGFTNSIVAAKFETIFRHAHKPVLNSPKNLRSISLNIPIFELI